jgi:uncharacterized protein
MNYTEADIIALHKKYASNEILFNIVFTHCKIVFEIAKQLIDAYRIEVDNNLIYVGAMLHDIGAYRVLDDSGDLIKGKSYLIHSVEGEDILKSEGFDENIYRFTTHHTGVGITRSDIIRQNLSLPLADYLAMTIEEELVMFADKFHSKSIPPKFNSFNSARNELSKFGKDKVSLFEQFATKFGQPDLNMLSEKYGFFID